MSWDYLSEEEAEELLQATYQNPMIVTVKCPSVQGGMLENAKLKKQMNYANSKQIKFVALSGEEEMKQNKISLKNMLTGEQQLLSVEEIACHIS